MPIPAVGGMPYSRAFTKSQSGGGHFFVAGGALGDLQLEPAALIVGIVELGKGVGDFHRGAEQLVAVGQFGVAGFALGQRREHDRVVVDERRMQQFGLDDTLEDLVERVRVRGRRRQPELAQDALRAVEREQRLAFQSAPLAHRVEVGDRARTGV